jgi:hypothetical protein
MKNMTKAKYKEKRKTLLVNRISVTRASAESTNETKKRGEEQNPVKLIHLIRGKWKVNRERFWRFLENQRRVVRVTMAM